MMEFLEKMFVENYKFVLVFLVLVTATYRFFSKRQKQSNAYLIEKQQLENEKLVIKEFYRNDNTKSVHLKNSKIHIHKYEKPNNTILDNKLILKEKKPKFTIKHRGF